MMSSRGHAFEAGSTRAGRWLQAKRLQFALWIAAVESILWLVAAISLWLAVAFAAVGVVLYWYVGRSTRSDVVRHALWILAVSQLIVVVFPLLWGFVKAVVVVLLALLAIAGLVVLFTERRQ
jgi:hypothetical protein